MNDFAETDDEARRRSKVHKSSDPFPEIPSALLNSADIYEYVAKTGLVFPFDPDPKKLKSASYEVDFLGEVYYWDDEAKPRHWIIEAGTKFELPKNSIAFVFLQTAFRLPDYIALRFNLKITHVHRGLLLGTGPLVDPGYEGRLLVPLHNLTSHPYELHGGHGLIWVEYTKLSPNGRWSKECTKSSLNYHPFPDDKKWMSATDFLRKASKGEAIQSSIPGEVRKAASDSQEARENSARAAQSAQASATHAQNIKRRFTNIAWVSIVGLLVTFGLGLFQIGKLVADANQYVINARTELLRAGESADSRTKEFSDLRKKVEQLESRLPKTTSGQVADGNKKKTETTPQKQP